MFINKFIHTADLHLGFKYRTKSLKARSDERKNELFDTFERLISYANEHEIDLILISGDLFERDLLTYTETKLIMNIIDSYFGKIILSAGNHDYFTDDYLYNNFTKNLYVFNSNNVQKLEIAENLTVYGASWINKTASNFDFKKLNLDKDKFNAFTCHGDVYDSKYKIDLGPILESDFDYIGLGHIHKPSKVFDKAYYAGSLEPLDFGELGEHGFYEIDTVSSEVKFVSFASREFKICDINISDVDDFQDIIKKFEELNDKDKDFYRINLKGSISSELNINRIINIIKDKFYYLETYNYLKEKSYIDNDIYEKILIKADSLEEDIKNDAINIAIKALQSTEHYYED